MSEFDSNEHEEIARRLREDGPAQAPPDIAGEVMKQVRSEPRRSTSSVRRPVVTLLAASLIVVALVAGLAKLGGGSTSSSSSAGGVSGGGGAATTIAPTTEQSGAGGTFVQSKTVNGVPSSALRDLRAQGVLFSAALADTDALCVLKKNTFSAVGGLTLDVPYAAWYPVQAQLDNARRAVPAATPLVNVHLRRLAPGATARGGVTCP